MLEQLKNINLTDISNLLVYNGNPLLFNTGLFLLLFLLFLGLYQLTKRSFKYNSIFAVKSPAQCSQQYKFHFFYTQNKYHSVILKYSSLFILTK